MNTTKLLVAALATWQAVEIWRHSDLFATRRALAEESPGFKAAILRCPWCLSVWVGSLAMLLTVATTLTWKIVNKPTAALDFGDWLVTIFIAPWVWLMYALAISRLANLGNDLTHAFCRTPRQKAQLAAEPSGDAADWKKEAPPGITRCARCGYRINRVTNFCVNDQCPFDRHYQHCDRGWFGHPAHADPQESSCNCPPP